MNLTSFRWPRVAITLGMATGVAVFFVAVFVWSGLYNVAASRDHLSVTTWLLQQVREQSVATRSIMVESPPSFDEGMVRLGASHYEAGCAPCHSRPGEPINPIVSGMLPSPPDLKKALSDRGPEEIFWIVRHGLKYTGMPPWPNQIRTDEVWAVTAFLESLQRQSDEDYRDWSGLARVAGASEPASLDNFDAFTVCSRCHDTARLGTNGDRVPRLAGQQEAYLLRSLREYARRERPSGVMEPVAALLDDSAMRDLASRYANAPSTVRQPSQRDRMRFERGRILAVKGLAEKQIPGCNSCHGEGRSPQFPTLAGQNADYLATQLELWQRGGRAETTYGRIMAPIAQRLTPDQISDVSYYYQEWTENAARAGLEAPP